MKRIIKFWPVAVLLVIAAAGYWFYQSRSTSTASRTASTTYTQIVQVQQGSLSSSVSVVGQLDAVQSETLSFSQMDGTTKLSTLSVAAGNTVHQGQVLASIDPAPYQQALDEAQSALNASAKTLADLKAPATTLELAQSDLAIAQSKYDLQKAQSDLDDLVHPDLPKLQADVANAQSALTKAQANVLAKQNDDAAKKQLSNLYEAEATPSAEYNRLAAETYSDEYYQDRLRVAYNQMMDAQDARVTYETQQQSDALSAQMQVRDAQQTLADAQKALDTAQAGGDKLTVAKAQVAVQTAQVALAKSQDDRAKLEAGPDATELATDQADVDKKQLAVIDATTALSGTQLVASFDGTVLQTNVKVGDDVTASTAVLTVANLKGLQVVASVDETTIKRVTAGQTAEISFDAFPGQTFKGKVLSVPLQGALQNDVMVYEVPISLEGADKLALLVGMTANVKVQVAQAQNALLVPTMALQKVNGLYEVLVPSDTPQGQPVAVPVEVGLSDGVNSQITKGLNVGDQVVVQMQATTGQSNNNFPGGGGFGPILGGAGPAPVIRGR